MQGFICDQLLQDDIVDIRKQLQSVVEEEDEDQDKLSNLETEIKQLQQQIQPNDNKDDEDNKRFLVIEEK